MGQYIFRKPGFKKRQSDKLKSPDQRQAILVDSNLNNDHKMASLHAQKDHTLLGILFEIWANIDLETETYETNQEHFDHWVRKTFSASNRFDVLKRLQWLSNNGLIEFKHIPNDSLTESYQVPNDVLNESYSHPNEILTGSYTPLEIPETQAALRATKPTNITNQPTSSPLPPIWEEGEEDADLKKKLDLVLVYKISGERKTEYQWFKEQVIHELKRSNYRRINLLGGVESLIASNAVVQKLGRFWISRPKHERMAAIAFVIGNPNARNELSYAMSAIEKKYRDYVENISICEKAVSQNDLEVIVNA